MGKLGSILFAISGLAVLGPARAGHETPIYPSYYPQEIQIQPFDPAAAGRALGEGRIQAYVGTRPAFPGGPGEAIRYVESLGSYLVVDLNPESPRVRAGKSACPVAEAVIGSLAEGEGDFRFHPYPVNAFHADYLHHFDLAGRAKNRFLGKPEATPPGLAVRAAGALAEKMVRRRWPGTTANWDAKVEEISLGRLLAGRRFNVNGRLGPPWLKEGWYHAYLLLAGALTDQAAKDRVEAHVRRLQRGDYDSPEEVYNLERELVTLLTGACRRVVAGYRVRREYYSADYAGGVENIAIDSHTGFNSAIFIRTVKLKDFPWNGWLTLGMGGKPAAAWNPIGGFTDDAGRLIWSALGDPALFPEPYNAGWTLNRIGDVKATAGE